MKTANPATGTITLALASALKVAIQIIVLPVIGRVLGPHAYGQIALVTPFIFFAMMIAESGLGACIVRAEKITPALEGTVFCFSSGLSLAIIAVFAAVAWPLGRYLHEPLFPPLLLAMSSILLLASLHIVPSALLLRGKRYDWMAASDVIAAFTGVAGTILGLVLGWGVWSLVAQQVAFWVAKLAVVTLGSRSRPHFVFHLSLLKENAQFGANLTGGTILNFVARNIDNVLIGACLGTQVLGYYAMAFQIIGLPQMILSGSVYFTLFTSTSEAHRLGKPGNGKLDPGTFMRTLQGALLIVVPALTGIAATAPLAVPLLLGGQWQPLPLLIWLLVPLGIAQASGAATTGFLIGLGRSDITFRINLIAASATVAAIVIGVQFSSAAVAIGVSLTALLGQALALRAVRRACDDQGGGFRRIFVPPLAASLVMGIAVEALERCLPAMLAPLPALIVSVLAGILIYGAALFLFFRRHFRAMRGLMQTLLFARLNRNSP